ncbi:MAG: hypothetical protein HQK54_17705 [Oligoflexales bacterium]|nr:hypothetical protein [Oligoflexales bacterium]
MMMAKYNIFKELFKLGPMMAVVFLNGCNLAGKNGGNSSLLKADSVASTSNVPKMEVNNAVMQGQEKICEADMKVAWSCKFLKHLSAKKLSTTQQGQACGIEIRDSSNKSVFEKYPELTGTWGDDKQSVSCYPSSCLKAVYFPEGNYNTVIPKEIKLPDEFSLSYRIKWRLDYNLAGGRKPVEGILCAKYVKGTDGCWTMQKASDVGSTSDCLTAFK